MAPTVVVVEYDVPMRQYLRLVLEGAGYAVVTPPTFDTALGHLRACEDSVDVIVANATPDNRLEADFFATVTAGGQVLTRHRYVLLTTTPEHVSPSLHHQLEELHAPILKKPFNQEQLLAVLRDTAQFTSMPHARTVY